MQKSEFPSAVLKTMADKRRKSTRALAEVNHSLFFKEEDR
jgi:hypothetical protein